VLRAGAADINEHGVRKPAVSIYEDEKDPQGNRRIAVLADNAEITDLLKDMFKKSGDQYTIDQDISGPVDLNIKYATFAEVYRRIAESAKPPLKIQMDGKLYRVTRVTPLVKPDEAGH